MISRNQCRKALCQGPDMSHGRSYVLALALFFLSACVDADILDLTQTSMSASIFIRNLHVSLLI